jgi:hypothetical protein
VLIDLVMFLEQLSRKVALRYGATSNDRAIPTSDGIARAESEDEAN